MKKETLKNLTHAHAWLGVIISGVLMIVFLCGTISFFRDSVIIWDKHYNPQKVKDGPVASIPEVINLLKQKDYTIPADHPVSINTPFLGGDFYYVSFETELEDGSHEFITLTLDQHSLLEVEDDYEQYYLGNMLYRLHINLLLPFGRELVGIVSLLFFVIVISGLFIHFKKMISHFYQYRLSRNKDTYLDGHNLIGVSSLPYTFLYALTGVMFNLSMVFQAGFGFAVFQGDIDKLLDTSGFPKRYQVEASGEEWPVQNVEAIILDVQRQYPKYKLGYMDIFGYGDKDAIIQLEMVASEKLLNKAILSYQLDDMELLSEVTSNNNGFSSIYDILTNLHIGEYGGVTLKLIYFLLGLACCYLILTGNLIWLEKRENHRHQSNFGLRFVKAMTLTLSSGTLIAVAVSFVATRFTPEAYVRIEFLQYVFLSALVVSLVHSYGLNKARRAMQQQLLIAGIMFALCPIFDVAMLLNTQLPTSSFVNVWLVNLSLTLSAVFCILLYRYKSEKVKLGTKPENLVEQLPAASIK